MFETGDLDFDDDIFESELLDNPVVDSPTKTVIESTSKSTKGVFVKPAAVVRKTHKIVKRKFPGPAGLLPEMRNLNVDLTKMEDSFKENDSSDNNEYFCSQNSVSNFCEDTWLKALDDFQGSTVNLVESYNIAWIKDRAKTGKLINDKAPFLLVLIKKIECVSKPPTFILEDPSGFDVEQARSTRIGRIPEKGAHRKFLTKAVWLNNNRLTNFDNLDIFLDSILEYPERLGWLDLSFNRIYNISPVIQKYVNLKILYLHGNRLSNLEDVKKLSVFSQLRTVTLHGNPIAEKSHYRGYVLLCLPQLGNMDFTPVSNTERNEPIRILIHDE